MSVAQSALLTYNAALNRPAYQSSVYVHRNGNFTANLANDGNHETNATKDNQPWCSVSQNEANPWWAVDLGRPTTIYRVDLTNRADDGGTPLFCLEIHNVQLLLLSYVYSVYGWVYHIMLSCFHIRHTCADESYSGVCNNV